MSAAGAAASRRAALAALALAVWGARAAVEPPAARAGTPAGDAGKPAVALDPEVRQMAIDFVIVCWHARWSDPDLLDRCYAREDRFRAMRVGPKGEVVVPRARWISERLLGDARNGGRDPRQVIDYDPNWPSIKVEPGKVAGEIKVSFFHRQTRAPRSEGVWREITLGSGAPGPSPAIVEEREDARPPTMTNPIARLPLQGAPACPTSAELRAGAFVVATSAHATFGAALAAAKQARAAKRAAEIVPGRWLSPPEETFVIAAGAFADRAGAERRAAELGGRVLEVAALGPGGAVPAWGLEAVGRIDGLGEMIDLGGDRVVTWSSSESTGWRLRDDGLVVEAGVFWPFEYPPPRVIDPFTEQKRPYPVGPRLPGLSAPIDGAGPAIEARVDGRGDQLQGFDAAGRPVWTLSLAARDRVTQVFPRKHGLYMHFDASLFLLRRAAAPGIHLGKVCGVITVANRRVRTAAVTLASGGGAPLRLDGDGTFELWVPVPSMAGVSPDLATVRCGRRLTPTVRGSSSELITELGSRGDIQVECE